MNFYDEKFPDLTVQKKESSLWVTLNRPESRNAISLKMISSFEKLLPYADRDPDISVIVLTGAGRSFCAGGDVKDMKSKKGMFAGDSNELRSHYEFGIQKIPRLIESLSTPIIAQVNGAAIGAGCDLAMMCDLRVGDQNSKFAETFARLGLVPGDGGTFFLPRVVGYSKAMEMFLTGQLISGAEAKSYGLLNFLAGKEQSLEEKTKEIIDLILKSSPVALALTKKVLKNSYQLNLNSQLDQLSAYQGMLQRMENHFDRLEEI